MAEASEEEQAFLGFGDGKRTTRNVRTVGRERRAADTRERRIVAGRGGGRRWARGLRLGNSFLSTLLDSATRAQKLIDLDWQPVS